jgi:hypothetical protein
MAMQMTMKSSIKRAGDCLKANVSTDKAQLLRNISWVAFYCAGDSSLLKEWSAWRRLVLITYYRLTCVTALKRLRFPASRKAMAQHEDVVKACADLRAGAVKTLTLEGKGLADADALALAAALEQNTSLTTLYLKVRWY